MPGEKMVKNVHEWKCTATRSLGRPKNRWENYVKNGLNIRKIRNSKDCIQNRHKWKGIAEEAKTLNH
jgi:hypothetical protein